MKPIQPPDPDAIKAFQTTAQRILAHITCGIEHVVESKRAIGKLTPDDND